MSHQLTPPMLIDHVAQGRFAGTLEAVVLLVDISGFTTLTNRLMRYGTEGAEVLATVLAELFEPLLHLVYRQGGFVATFGGDAFKAIFPVHQAPTPDTAYARAIVAAEQIRRYLIAHSEQTTRFGAFHFAGKVCLASGLVEWGVWQGATTGASTAQQAAYYVEGAALDACMALDSYSTAGEVLLTQEVYAALPAAVTLLQIEPVAAHWRLRTVAEGYLKEWRPLPLAVPATPGDLAARFFSPDLLAINTQGEFRRVVTLFLNLQAAPQTLDSAFQHTFFRLLAQYGGYLCRVGLSGSGQSGITLLLFWGAPVSHENDVERALSFVQALQSASPAPLRAGVTTSLAYAGFVGSTLREEYTCYGTHVNLAVRQMTKAAWGEIWLDTETARQAQAAFAVTHHGHFAFKGFAAPQPVFRLGARHDSIATFYQGELIGRQAELAHLRAAVQPIFTGHFAGVILVTGEAGMGKSRLVHELQREGVGSREEGVGSEQKPALLPTSSSLLPPQWFLCQTDEILRQSLNPFRYWLRSYFRQSLAQGEAANKQMFTAKLDELIADLDATRLVEDNQAKLQNRSAERVPAGRERLKSEIERTHSFLGALVDLYWPDSLYAQLEPQLRFENTLIALKTLIQAESLRRPVILHLEDAHWLDGDSRTCLAHLTRNIEQFPLAVVITSRPPAQEGAAPIALVPPDVPQITIDLTVLNVDAIRQLATDRLGGALAPDLLALLTERAEGNPFFAEQLLLYLQEQGALESHETGWRLRDGVATGGLLPDDARALLVARLDRLAVTVKEVVQTAAVLGREFAVQILSQMLRTQADLVDRLKNAEEAAIWSALSELQYLFKHSLLRDAAYNMQLKAQLRSLHRLAALSIEQLYAPELALHAAALAHHYAMAEEFDAAAHWYEQAGGYAFRQFANQDAFEYFSRALDFTAPTAASGRYRILLAREEVLDRQTARQLQAADVEALSVLAEQMGAKEQAEAAQRRANYAEGISNYAIALTEAQAAVRFAQVAHDQVTEAAAYRKVATALWRQGKLTKAHLAAEQAVTIMQTLPPAIETVAGLNELSIVCTMLEQSDAARNYLAQGLQLTYLLNDRVGEGVILSNLGVLFERLGDFATAGQHFIQALQINCEVGDRWSEGISLNNLGVTATYLGQYEQAQQYLEQALQVRRANDDHDGEGSTRANLAHLCNLTNANEVALYQCQQALALAMKIENPMLRSKVLLYRADTLATLGRQTEALQDYQQILALTNELGRPNLAILPLVGLACVYRDMGNLAVALDYVEQIMPLIEINSLDKSSEPLHVCWACYDILSTNQDERCSVLLLAGYKLLQTRAAKILDESLRRSFLENVPANRAILEEFTRLHPAGLSTADQPSFGKLAH